MEQSPRSLGGWQFEVMAAAVVAVLAAVSPDVGGASILIQEAALGG